MKANNGNITLETTIGTDYRISIPKAIRSLIAPEDLVWVKIEKVIKNV